MSVGSVLREQREKRRLKQNKVADLAGLDPSYLCRVETGKIKTPRDKNLRKLRAVLWPEASEAKERDLRLVPNSLPLEEFLDKVAALLKLGQVAELRGEELPMADWLKWLHLALLELQDRYGQAEP